MEHGNNGEIRQDDHQVMEIQDWHYRDHALRAQFIPPIQRVNDMMPMQVILRNGDEAVVDAMFYVHGELCDWHGIARLELRPVIVLGFDLTP